MYLLFVDDEEIHNILYDILIIVSWDFLQYLNERDPNNNLFTLYKHLNL